MFVVFSFWLPNDFNELTETINKRIEMVTGLNLDHAEELQVANYGLGGHYAPHYDHARVRFEFLIFQCLN